MRAYERSTPSIRHATALATQPEAQNSAGHLERTNSQITEALAKERLARERSDAKVWAAGQGRPAHSLPPLF